MISAGFRAGQAGGKEDCACEHARYGLLSDPQKIFHAIPDSLALRQRHAYLLWKPNNHVSRKDHAVFIVRENLFHPLDLYSTANLKHLG